MADYGTGRAFHTDFTVIYPPKDDGGRRRFGVKLASPIHISDYFSHKVTGQGHVQFADGLMADDIEIVYDCSFDGDNHAWLLVRLSDLQRAT